MNKTDEPSKHIHIVKIEDKDIELHIDRETLLQEYIPRAEFEQRLKDDMLTILTDIQLNIEKIETEFPLTDSRQNCCGFEYKTAKDMRIECVDLIQEKINALKGEYR